MPDVPEDAGMQEERDEDDPFKFDRPRGILTEADRRYLCGESDIKPKSHSERRARERIRQRVKHGMLDFEILLRHLEERDRDLIGYDDPDRAYARAPRFMIGFLYFFFKENHVWLADDIEKGIEEGLGRCGWMGEAECGISVEREEKIEEIPEGRIRSNLRDVTREQLRDMLISGVISDEQFSDEIRRRDGSEK